VCACFRPKLGVLIIDVVCAILKSGDLRLAETAPKLMQLKKVFNWKVNNLEDYMGVFFFLYSVKMAARECCNP
jgi:hypothetical protein